MNIHTNELKDEEFLLRIWHKRQKEEEDNTKKKTIVIKKKTKTSCHSQEKGPVHMLHKVIYNNRPGTCKYNKTETNHNKNFMKPT